MYTRENMVKYVVNMGIYCIASNICFMILGYLIILGFLSDSPVLEGNFHDKSFCDICVIQKIMKIFDH